ncbi:ribonuclease III domain-containing protein [Aspergillus karnatakaensis]|uniref:ribonuclease III domain-containing protein n=1 Tax=Aspergillus karnatakaensis TaxID=1810916 RepID=UPI003CCDB71E
MTSRATEFQQTFSLPFTNQSLITEALIAPGITSREGNKSLAQIGDTVLQLALQLEGRERGVSRERINNIISNRAGNANLARRGFALGLDRFIRKNPSQGSFCSDRLMADTMEAIVGAYFEDRGREFAALKVVLDVLGLGWPEDGEEK